MYVDVCCSLQCGMMTKISGWMITTLSCAKVLSTSSVTTSRHTVLMSTVLAPIVCQKE
jgi:hypothetical protein